MESISFLTSGILFGLAAGISPGPLLTLVISETLRHNRKQGIIVAIVPAVTDLPIVLLSVFILAKLSSFNLVLGAISILGALFIGYHQLPESTSLSLLDISGRSDHIEGPFGELVVPYTFHIRFLHISGRVESADGSYSRQVQVVFEKQYLCVYPEISWSGSANIRDNFCQGRS